MPDPFARPLPMQSLATEEDNWMWNKPPQYADYEEFVASLKEKLESDKKAREDIMDMLFIGATIEDVVNTISTVAFSEGKVTPDAAELAKLPIALMLMDIANEEGVTVKIFSQTPNDFEAEEINNKLQLMQQFNPEGFEAAQKGINQQASLERDDEISNKKSKESFLKMENENVSVTV
jgi:hypothetical protein|tara:strand:+ start:2067 stop:2600 length:534 start_codon:yes stop_codon:yes gene_type:complete